MRQYSVLQSVIRKNIPILVMLPPEKRKEILKQVLNKNLVSILLKVNLPDPVEFRMKMMKEHYLDLRRRKGAKHNGQEFNHNLWRKLYEVKSMIKHNLLENAQITTGHYNDFSSTVQQGTDISVNTIWKIPNTTSSSSVLKNINQVISNVEVSSELESKMLTNQPYNEFVNCINDTCKSYEVEKLGFAEYLLHEKKDMENLKWTKIILDTKLYEKDFEEKMIFWERLRNIIDGAIEKLKHGTNNLEQVIELEKQFYINISQ